MITTPEQLNDLHTKRQKYIDKGTIWAFWEGEPPELVLRCIETVRMNNKSRPVVVLSTETTSLFLDECDFPTYNGRPGLVDDFSCIQYYADWVRVTLLEKYGGVWFDASVICTSPVESWIAPPDDDDDDNKITMFPFHANQKIHGNWTMGVTKPGHPLLQAWRAEFARVLDEAGSGELPLKYCEQAFIDHPELYDVWHKPRAPPLPYLWVYLVLQVVLQNNPELHSTIYLRPSIDGPMYRRHLVNIEGGIDDQHEISNKTAEHLASNPLHDEFDRFFIKLVGKDRDPIQRHLEKGEFEEGSAMDTLSRVPPRGIKFGSFLRGSVRTLGESILSLDCSDSFESMLAPDSPLLIKSERDNLAALLYAYDAERQISERSLSMRSSVLIIEMINDA